MPFHTCGRHFFVYFFVNSIFLINWSRKNETIPNLVKILCKNGVGGCAKGKKSMKKLRISALLLAGCLLTGCGSTEKNGNKKRRKNQIAGYIFIERTRKRRNRCRNDFC